MPLPSVRTLSAADLASGAASGVAVSLEHGAIVQLPEGALPLPSEADLEFLRERLAELLALKNVSYHPVGDYLSGIQGDGEARERTRGILRRHQAEVAGLLGRLLPEYAEAWRPGKVNYRPLEQRGRKLSRHSSNELLHVDAFASGATHGDRTLRFFTNVNPTVPRVWKSAGLFEELLREFGPRAGVPPARGLEERLLDRALSALVRSISALGLPQAMTVDTSPYDRAMRRMHNFLKDDDAFQDDAGRCARFEFPPFASWLVFTDLVSHACVSGRHALVCTWTVGRSSLRLPELSPYAVMQRRAV